jgi:hypothetical protein
LLLKVFESEARFPDDLDELPAAAVAYAVEQVKVPAAKLAEYGWPSFRAGAVRAAHGGLGCPLRRSD